MLGRKKGDNSIPIIGLEKVGDADHSYHIKHLREIGHAITSFLLKKKKKNRGARGLGEAAQHWLDLTRRMFCHLGPEEFKNTIKEVIKFEGTKFEETGLKTDLVDGISSVKFSFKDGDEIFAAEAMTHLLQKGAEHLVGSAMAAAMEFFLSTTLSKVWRDHAIGVFEESAYGMSYDFLANYLMDDSHSPAERFTTIRLLRSWLDLYDNAYEKKYSKQLLDWENKLMLIGAKQYAGWSGNGPKKGADYQYFVETYTFIARLFKFINFAATARSYYGDSADSIEEARRKFIDADRGFIYIAWAPYLNKIWEADLKKKGLSDCVKIGYSEDPDVRKDQIAGNIGTPDSIEIIDAWPVMNMREAEKVVHNKLDRFRLSPERELFGLEVDESISKVDEILQKVYGPSVKQRKTSSGFG